MLGIVTLQRRIHTPTTGNDLATPVEVLKPPLSAPVAWWSVSNIADVTNPITKLDELRFRRQLWCVFDLESLANGLRQFLVIGDLSDKPCYRDSRMLRELRLRRSSVLDRVMENCSLEDNEISHATHTG